MEVGTNIKNKKKMQVTTLFQLQMLKESTEFYNVPVTLEKDWFMILKNWNKELHYDIIT